MAEEIIGGYSLKNLMMTEEDFADIRNIQPFVMTEDQLWNYEIQYKGEERIDDRDCWVLSIRPRQILSGQRLFDARRPIRFRRHAHDGRERSRRPPSRRNRRERGSVSHPVARGAVRIADGEHAHVTAGYDDFVVRVCGIRAEVDFRKGF